MSARVFGRSSFAMPANSAMSLVRVWRNMNSRIGPWARSSAWTCVILPFCSGSQACFLTWANVGCITKIVRNSAMPTSTWLGGAVGVPRPLRMKPRTMRIREKPVTVNSSAGTSVIPPSMSRICSALEPSTFTSAPSAARGGRGRLVVLERAAVEQAQGARLVLAVGADRLRDLLGDTEQHELAARADEVQRAVRAQRDGRDRLEALAGGGALAARLDLLE